MRGLWHYAHGQNTHCGQDWIGKKIDTVGSLQAWFKLLMREAQDPRIRLCFRCVYEVALETEADRRAFLKVTIMQGGVK